MDADLAADCAQEAMVRAWMRIGELRDDGRFGGWLRRIATRLCLDAMRRERREAALGSGLTTTVPSGPSPDDVVLLQQVMESLSAEERVMIVLRADGARWREVADALDISESAARMRGSRLMKRLEQT